MVEIKEKERAIIEFTCIPDVSIEKAQQLYDIGFKHLHELLAFSLDEEAKAKGLVEILNYWILSQFLSLEDEEIPTKSFKCPFCKGTVYGDEETCSDCGALLLEEILEVGMDDVYTGLQKVIDAILENPEAAKKRLKGSKEEGDEEQAKEVELGAPKIDKPPTMESGIIAVPIIPKEEGNNYLITISPLDEHEEERKTTFEDLKKLGAGNAVSYSIDGGNITNEQEKAIRSVVSRFIRDQDLNAFGTERLLILNLKIARFSESKPTVIIEDNRHFLSSFDGISPDDPEIESIKNMLYDAELIREIRKIGDESVLDGVSFNNDPISFLTARECIPILKENDDINVYLLDLVVNTNYVGKGKHNDLLQLLQKWEKKGS